MIKVMLVKLINVVVLHLSENILISLMTAEVEANGKKKDGYSDVTYH